MNELIYRRELQEALDAADEALYYGLHFGLDRSSLFCNTPSFCFYC